LLQGDFDIVGGAHALAEAEAIKVVFFLVMGKSALLHLSWFTLFSLDFWVLASRAFEIAEEHPLMKMLFEIVEGGCLSCT
jgi:hypothetical protein